MPVPRDSLSEIQREVAKVRSFLKYEFPVELDECNHIGFFRTWVRRIRILSGSVHTLAMQVDRLARSVDDICNILNDEKNL